VGIEGVKVDCCGIEEEEELEKDKDKREGRGDVSRQVRELKNKRGTKDPQD